MAPIVGVEITAQLKPPKRRFGKLNFEWGEDDLELTSKPKAFVRRKSPGDELKERQVIKFFREILWEEVIPEVKKLMRNNGFKNWVITDIWLGTESDCARSWQFRGHSFQGLNIKV